MHTRETEHESPGLGATVKSVSERASSLVRLELELAALELKRKVFLARDRHRPRGGSSRAARVRAGLRPGDDRGRHRDSPPVVGALLIVTFGILLVAALLGFLGVRAIKKGTPPVPEQALAEAKLTTEALKGNGRH